MDNEEEYENITYMWQRLWLCGLMGRAAVIRVFLQQADPVVGFGPGLAHSYYPIYHRPANFKCVLPSLCIIQLTNCYTS